jgi:hypothetical protein
MCSCALGLDWTSQPSNEGLCSPPDAAAAAAPHACAAHCTLHSRQGRQLSITSHLASRRLLGRPPESGSRRPKSEHTAKQAAAHERQLVELRQQLGDATREAVEQRAAGAAAQKVGGVGHRHTVLLAAGCRPGTSCLMLPNQLAQLCSRLRLMAAG